MSSLSHDSFLRRVLYADALTSGACGLLMLVASGPLEAWLGVPAAWLRLAGATLLPWAAIVAWIAARDTPSRGAVWAVIVCNVVWAADSLLLLVAGPIDPTPFGYAFVIAQALIVAAFAEAQYVGLRRSPAVVVAA